MAQELWPEVNHLVARALELPREDRARFVEWECDGRADLLSEVESLLAAFEESDGFLEPPKRRIGAYELLEPLGSGALGTVYRARREDPYQDAAVRLAPPGAAHPDVAQRFLEDQHVLMGLDHPNIARLLGAGYAGEEQLYLVTEYVEGEPITAYCRDRKLGVQARLRLFLPLCAAAQYAHERQVAHRDLKPGNVLVTAAGVPRLLDFGIARILDSPDAWQATVAIVSDIRALGALLSELLAGDQAGADVEAVIRKAMQEDPAGQYASAGEMAAALERILDGPPPAAPRRKRGYAVMRFAWRHLGLVAVGAATVLVLSAAVDLVIRQAQEPQTGRPVGERRTDAARSLAHSILYALYDKIAALPDSAAARQELVAAATGYLDALEVDAAGDPALQADLCDAFLRIAAIQESSSAALKGYARAERLARTMVATARNEANLVRLIGVLEFTALVYLRGGWRDRAVPYTHEALALAREAAARAPGDDRVRRTLAKALHYHESAMATTDGRFVREAVGVLEPMAAASPRDPVLQSSTAAANRLLGEIMEDAQRWDEAWRYVSRAAALEEWAVAEYPEDRQWPGFLADSYGRMVLYWAAKKRYSEGLDYAGRAVALRLKLFEAEPEDAGARRRLAVAWAQKGDMERHAALPRAAAQSFGKAIAILRGLPDSASDARLGASLVSLAQVHRSLGRRGPMCADSSEALRIFQRTENGDTANDRYADSRKTALELAKRCGKR